MTNFHALVLVTLFTSNSESLHPSGNVKVMTSVVYERHETAPYYWNDRKIVIATNIPVATNITRFRMTWQPEPTTPRQARDPISIKDLPMKKQKPGVKPEKETK